MGRSRSRSPRRERRRSRSRDRERRKERRKSRSPRRRRSRSRSPRIRRSRSFSPRPKRSRSRERTRIENHRAPREVTDHVPLTQPSSSQLNGRPELSESQLEGKTDEEVEMMKMMGFCGFDTTKNKKVQQNDTYVANIQRKRRYRQYMNRKGGFNRPLDFIA